jgi:uncharacterized protein (DUF433 family)
VVPPSAESTATPGDLTIDRDIMGGLPCVAGHRITIAQLLGEAAEWGALDDLAVDMRCQPDEFRAAMRAAARYFAQASNFAAKDARIAELESALTKVTQILTDVHAAVNGRKPHDARENARCTIEWIEDAKETIALWRPVVEAAKAWNDSEDSTIEDAAAKADALEAAVEALGDDS